MLMLPLGSIFKLRYWKKSCDRIFSPNALNLQARTNLGLKTASALRWFIYPEDMCIYNKLGNVHMFLQSVGKVLSDKT